MNEFLKPTFEWIKDDWNSHPVRFGIELLAWGISIGCSITMAATVPTPPLLVLYPIWIAGCALYAWAAYTRNHLECSPTIYYSPQLTQSV